MIKEQIKAIELDKPLEAHNIHDGESCRLQYRASLHVGVEVVQWQLHDGTWQAGIWRDQSSTVLYDLMGRDNGWRVRNVLSPSPATEGDGWVIEPCKCSPSCAMCCVHNASLDKFLHHDGTISEHKCQCFRSAAESALAAYRAKSAGVSEPDPHQSALAESKAAAPDWHKGRHQDGWDWTAWSYSRGDTSSLPCRIKVAGRWFIVQDNGRVETTIGNYPGDRAVPNRAPIPASAFAAIATLLSQPEAKTPRESFEALPARVRIVAKKMREILIERCNYELAAGIVDEFNMLLPEKDGEEAREPSYTAEAIGFRIVNCRDGKPDRIQVYRDDCRWVTVPRVEL